MKSVFSIKSASYPLDRRWSMVLALLAVLLILVVGGCSSGKDDKTVLQVQLRPNRAAAQPAASQNVYNTNRALHQPTSSPATPAPVAPTPLPPTASPTGDVQRQQEESTYPTPTRPALPTATATPLSIPIGRPERVVIPSLGVDTVVTPVSASRNQIGAEWFQNWNTAAHAAGFHESSALLGQAGNTVISGHNNIEGAVFRDLYQVQPGELIQLYADGFRYDYIVEDQFVVREAGTPIEQRLQNAGWIQTTIDERVTLVSCWPPDGNSHRVIVVARPATGHQLAASTSGVQGN